MARIATPTGAHPYVPVAIETADTQVFLLYGDPAEPRWAAAWREDGDDATRAAIAPDAPPPSPSRDTRATDDSCRSGGYSAVNRLADPRYRYFARGLSTAEFKQRAEQIITRTINVFNAPVDAKGASFGSGNVTNNNATSRSAG